MKRVVLLLIVGTLVLSLSGCFILREKLLAPPDEVQIPEDSKQAVCIQDNVTHTYIYRLDGVYEYYIDDELQNQDALTHEQEQAYLHNESVYNYLMDEYGSTNCTITNYNDSTQPTK